MRLCAYCNTRPAGVSEMQAPPTRYTKHLCSVCFWNEEIDDNDVVDAICDAEDMEDEWDSLCMTIDQLAREKREGRIC